MLAGALPGAAHSMRSEPTPVAGTRRWMVLETPVAGFQYHAGMRNPTVRWLGPGSPLAVHREPGNPYDSKAIALHAADGQRIGYVPRTVNLVPANLLDWGAVITAEMSLWQPDADPWERARARLWLIV